MNESLLVTILIISAAALIFAEIYKHIRTTAKFNDVVADEIMKIRNQLTAIEINQDKLGWGEHLPKEFIHTILMTNKYDNHYAWCHYKTPSTKDIDDAPYSHMYLQIGWPILKTHDDYFTAESLIDLHSKPKERKAFHKGMTINVVMYEKGVHDRPFSVCNSLPAKILSVTQDVYDVNITLEINLNGHPNGSYSYDLLKPDIIIRTVRLLDKSHLFIEDNNIPLLTKLKLWAKSS